MAYQPKSYRKFVATAATAAMVASAVGVIATPANAASASTFTDVSASYQDAVNFLVASGATNGLTDTTFGTTNNIKRVDAAVIVANLLKLDGSKAPDAGFTDVPARAKDAVNALYAAKIINGKTATTFGSDAYITRAEMAKVVALGLQLKADDSTALPFKDVSSTFAPFVKALYDNKVTLGQSETSFGANANITRGEFALFSFRAANITPATPAVVSVSAINAKALKVTFSKAVDTTKAVFGVTRGTSGTIAVTGYTVTWNDAKTEATLTQDSNYAADTYKVAVTGIDGLVAPANTASVTVVAQTVTNIKIVSTDLIKAAATAPAVPASATFTYKVLDQYGVDMTKSVADSDISSSAVVGSSSATVTLSPTTGVGTITHSFTDAEAAKTAVVTLVHKSTGVVSTSTLNVVAAASVKSLTFGTTEVYPSGKTKIEINQAAAVTVPVDAVDQYGNKITDYTQLAAAVNIVSSNAGAQAHFDQDADGNPVLVLSTNGGTGAAMTDKATVVLTLVNRTTGASWTKSFDVVKAAQAYKLVVNDWNQSTIAHGDTGLALAIDVYDQFGNKLSKSDIASPANKALIDSWVSVTGVGTLTVNNDPNSSKYGMLTTSLVTGAAGTSNENAVIVFNAADYSVVTKNVTILPARKVTTVNKINNTTLLQGASENLAFAFKDQYDAAIDSDDVKAGTISNGGLKYEVVVTKVSGDADGVTVTLPNKGGSAAVLTGTTVADLSKVHVVSDSSKTGSYKITMNLIDTTTNVVTSTASTVVNTAKNNVSGLTYSVTDIPTLNGSGVGGTTVSASTNAYAQKIVVNATDASGNSYVINPADVVNVTASNTKVTAPALDVSDGNWYVAGANISADTADATSTLTISVNTLDGIKTFTKTVNVTRAASAISKLRVVDAAIGGSTTDITALKDKLTYNIADLGISTTIHVIGLDQYGVWSDQTGAITTKVNSTDLADVNTFVVNASALTIAKVPTLASNMKVTLIKDSASVQITANVAALGTVSGTLTANAASTPNNTFTATEALTGFGLNSNFALTTGMVDMDSTPGIQSNVTINGITYTVAVNPTTHVAIVTATGTATAADAANADNATVTIADPDVTGATDTLTLTIGATTVGENASGVTYSLN